MVPIDVHDYRRPVTQRLIKGRNNLLLLFSVYKIDLKNIQGGHEINVKIKQNRIYSLDLTLWLIEDQRHQSHLIILALELAVTHRLEPVQVVICRDIHGSR